MSFGTAHASSLSVIVSTNNAALASKGSTLAAVEPENLPPTLAFSATLSSLFSETASTVDSASADPGSEPPVKHQKGDAHNATAAPSSNVTPDLPVQALLTQVPVPQSAAAPYWNLSAPQGVSTAEPANSVPGSSPSEQTGVEQGNLQFGSAVPVGNFKTFPSASAQNARSLPMSDLQIPSIAVRGETPRFLAMSADPRIRDDQSVSDGAPKTLATAEVPGTVAIASSATPISDSMKTPISAADMPQALARDIGTTSPVAGVNVDSQNKIDGLNMRPAPESADGDLLSVARVKNSLPTRGGTPDIQQAMKSASDTTSPVARVATDSQAKGETLKLPLALQSATDATSQAIHIAAHSQAKSGTPDLKQVLKGAPGVTSSVVRMDSDLQTKRGIPELPRSQESTTETTPTKERDSAVEQAQSDAPQQWQAPDNAPDASDEQAKPAATAQTDLSRLIQSLPTTSLSETRPAGAQTDSTLSDLTSAPAVVLPGLPALEVASGSLAPAIKGAPLKQGSLLNGTPVAVSLFPGQATITTNAATSVDQGERTGRSTKNSKQGDSESTARDQIGAQAVPAVSQPAVIQSTTSEALSSSLRQHNLSMDQPAPSATKGSAGSGSGNVAAEYAAQSHPSSALGEWSGTVSTSRLIQTLGQSEMRVGLRSGEFGDISIRTSATPDNLSAQISLSHDELAKSLTAHIPDAQAKVGTLNGFEITVNAAEQSAGASSSMSGAGTGSQGSRQQEQADRSYPSRFSLSSVTEQIFPAAVLTSPAHNHARHGRIDLQA